jgi:hypothetical protein
MTGMTGNPGKNPGKLEWLTGTGTKNPELTGTGTGIKNQHLTGTGIKNVTWPGPGQLKIANPGTGNPGRLLVVLSTAKFDLLLVSFK